MADVLSVTEIRAWRITLRDPDPTLAVRCGRCGRLLATLQPAPSGGWPDGTVMLGKASATPRDQESIGPRPSRSGGGPMYADGQKQRLACHRKCGMVISVARQQLVAMKTMTPSGGTLWLDSRGNLASKPPVGSAARYRADR